VATVALQQIGAVPQRGPSVVEIVALLGEKLLVM